VIEGRGQRNQRFHGPRDLSVAAEKERRKLCLVCSLWRNIADAIGHFFVDEPVCKGKNTLLLLTSRHTVAAVFNQYACARHATINVPFRELFDNSSRLCVLDLNLQLLVAIQFLTFLCGDGRHVANQLRSLFLGIYQGDIPLLSTPLDPPLAILATISSALPHLLELEIASDFQCNKVLGWGNASSTLSLPHLRRFQVTAPYHHMDLDWAAIGTGRAWNLPSLEHIAWNIGSIVPHEDLRYFGPTLQSLSIPYGSMTLISDHFWEVFPSLRHLCVLAPFHERYSYISIHAPTTSHPLQRLVLDPRRPINPETENRFVIMEIVRIVCDFLQRGLWVEWVRYVVQGNKKRKAEWNARDWELFRMALLRKGGYKKHCSPWRRITGWE
jgi:hypothetical protein